MTQARRLGEVVGVDHDIAHEVAGGVLVSIKPRGSILFIVTDDLFMGYLDGKQLEP